MAEKRTTSFLDINTRIVSGIKEGANESAVKKVIDKRVELEVNRRADLIDKAIDKYNTAKKELEKCKPDLISYGVVTGKDNDETGEPIRQEAYSEKKLKEKQALRKTISDLDIAIMKAMSENDYSKLQQLSGGGNNNKGKDESPAE